MRSVFALAPSALALCVSTGLVVVGLAVSADAAPMNHAHPSHHGRIIPRPGPGEAVPPGWYKFPGYPPIPPEQNRNLDPSNFGGG